LNRAPGFTLLEMLIAVGILSVALALTLGLTHSSTVSFMERVREADVENKGDRILTTMREELADSTKVNYVDVVDTQSGYHFKDAELWFKVPLKFVQTGTNNMGYSVSLQSYPGAVFPTDDRKFCLIWGWRDQRFTVRNLDVSDTSLRSAMPLLQGPGLRTNATALPQGIQLDGAGRTPEGFVAFRFQMDHNANYGKTMQNGVISEAQEGEDLDGDGLLNSTYAVGFIERACYVLPYRSGGWSDAQKADPSNYVVVDATRDVLGVTNVVQPVVLPGATTDPALLKTNRIFTLQGSRVDVNLWLLSLAANGHPFLIRRGSSIFMRNNTTYIGD
jgi:prepilin-type N-terminal cleavage/methylation domain-containing protein